MKKIVQLMFEAHHLKHIQRTGYTFLGTGKESVAEHSFITTFIALIMSEMEPSIDKDRLITMCLLHDLTEARIGDLNHFQKEYVSANEEKAMKDSLKGLSFHEKWHRYIKEFNEQKSPESKLAHDADQLSLIIDLKTLKDTGYQTPKDWLENIVPRLKTETGKKMAHHIEKSHKDFWWRQVFS